MGASVSADVRVVTKPNVGRPWPTRAHTRRGVARRLDFPILQKRAGRGEEKSDAPDVQRSVAPGLRSLLSMHRSKSNGLSRPGVGELALLFPHPRRVGAHAVSQGQTIRTPRRALNKPQQRPRSEAPRFQRPSRKKPGHAATHTRKERTSIPMGTGARLPGRETKRATRRPPSPKTNCRPLRPVRSTGSCARPGASPGSGCSVHRPGSPCRA